MGLIRTSIYVLVGAIILNAAINRFSRRDLSPRADGHVGKGFEAVEAVFREAVESGMEPGAAFAAYYKGEKVVDLWGGYADSEARQRWTNDTLGQFWSSTKGVAAMLIAHFVDAGRLSYDDKVVKHWPEFGKHGKEQVTVGQLISHQAGLAYFKERYEMSEIHKRPEEMSRIIENQVPLWTPGEACGYHPVNFGFIVDQLLRRVDAKKRPIDQLFRDVIGDPFDVDFYIGLPRREHHRVARTEATTGSLWHFIMAPWKVKLVTWTMFTGGSGSPIPAEYRSNPVDLHQLGSNPHIVNSRTMRETVCAASHGFGTARAVAKMYGILSNGGRYTPTTSKKGGKAKAELTLLSEKSIEALQTPLVSGRDLSIGINISYGPGTMLIHRREHNAKAYNVFGHPGYGGQMGYGDSVRRLAFAYVTNHNAFALAFENPRFAPLMDALYAAIDKLEAA